MNAPMDTSAGSEARYFELLARLSPAQRLEIAVRLSRSVRELAEAGVRLRHPGADEREVRLRLVEVLYGREAAERLGPLLARLDVR